MQPELRLTNGRLRSFSDVNLIGEALSKTNFETFLSLDINCLISLNIVNSFQLQHPDT